MCTALLSSSVNPIAVNKIYHIMYHIINPQTETYLTCYHRSLHLPASVLVKLLPKLIIANFFYIFRNSPTPFFLRLYKPDTLRSFCRPPKSLYDLYHHHHHVHEGLGVFPVPWSSRWSWSLHLFLGRPMFLRPFGLYCSACFCILFVSILCTCCSHFSWYCFISFTIFCAPVFFPNTLILFSI